MLYESVRILDKETRIIKHINEMAELWNVEIPKLEVGPEKGIEEIVYLMEQGKDGLFWNIFTNRWFLSRIGDEQEKPLKKPLLWFKTHF